MNKVKHIGIVLILVIAGSQAQSLSPEWEFIETHLINERDNILDYPIVKPLHKVPTLISSCAAALTTAITSFASVGIIQYGFTDKPLNECCRTGIKAGTICAPIAALIAGVCVYKYSGSIIKKIIEIIVLMKFLSNWQQNSHYKEQTPKELYEKIDSIEKATDPRSAISKIPSLFNEIEETLKKLKAE
jgi:hypothetical protein